MSVVRFSTGIIPVIPFEDDDVNPGLLGKGLANWLASNLVNTKYPVAEIIAEDWGYCVLIHNKPYMLWVGVGGESDYTWPEEGLTEEVASAFPLETIRWQLWVKTEMGFLSRLMRRDNRKNDAQELLELAKAKLVEAGVLITQD